MRKLYTILAAALMTASVFAQSPQKMSYQAVVRDGSNALVTSHPVGMQISILQGSASGTVVYTETQTPTTNTNGLISIEIGGEAGFADIHWANGPYFIKTETDPTGGTNYTITGTNQLLSVPYALHAKTAETFTGTITETDPTFKSSQAANITAPDITNLGKLSGTNTGDQDLSALATKVTAGTNVSITGTGTEASPYVINAAVSMTQIQRDALPLTSGLIIFNTTTNKPNYYNGTEWMNYDGTSAKTLAIGATYQGGIIAYILQSGDPGYDANVRHYIIAAIADQGTGKSWFNGSYIAIGGTLTALGTGSANTTIVVNKQGAGSYAAKLCYDLVEGGYSDWYLPSKDELNKLYLNKTAIGGFDNINNFYWSSSEADRDFAWRQNFSNGEQKLDSKYCGDYVRAIRFF